MSTIAASDTISTALFPKSRRTVLALLFGRPDRAFYLREIVEKTGLGVGHVQREVKRLSDGGILVRTRQGRHVYFQANENCPVFGELRALVTKTAGAVGVLREALSPLSGRVRLAFIFGSVASGQEQAESDLDLLVVGDVTFAEVVEAARAAEPLIGREVNPTVYPADEFRAKLNDGHRFLRSVVEREKLFVAGDEDELRDLSG